jgi:hypothetical protein
MEHDGTNPPPSDMTLSHQITERISRGKGCLGGGSSLAPMTTGPQNE